MHAVGKVLGRASWQRCRVHFMRNLLALVPHGAREAVAAVVRTIFAQPDHASAMAQLGKIVDGQRPRFAQAAALLAGAAEDLLAHKQALSGRTPDALAQRESAGTAEQGDQAPVERGGDLPEFAGAGAPGPGGVLMEQDDEWAVADRCYFSAESMRSSRSRCRRGRRRSWSRRMHRRRRKRGGCGRPRRGLPRSSKNSVSVHATDSRGTQERCDSYTT